MSSLALPGELGLPYFGEGQAFRRDPFGFTVRRARQHGPVWRTRIFGEELVFLAGREACAVFFEHGEDGPNVARDSAAPWGGGKLGERSARLAREDKRRRDQLVASAFTERALATCAPLLELIIGRGVARWAGKEQRIGGELRALAFDLANAMFAGADPDGSFIARAADLELMASGAWAPRAARWTAPVNAYGRALRAKERLRAYLGAAITDGAAAGTALAALKAARDAEGRGFTATELEEELLQLFVSARSSIAAALAWMTVALAQAPLVARGIRDELIAPRGASALARPLTGAFCREVVRAYPIATNLHFGTARRPLVVGKLVIPRGTRLAAASWAMLQDDGAFAMPSSPLAALAQLASTSLRQEPHLTRLPGPRCPTEALTALIMQLYAKQVLAKCELALPAQELTFGAGGLDGAAPLPASGLIVAARRRPELRLVGAIGAAGAAGASAG